jgi:hypothetical protein
MCKVTAEFLSPVFLPYVVLVHIHFIEYTFPVNFFVFSALASHNSIPLIGQFFLCLCRSNFVPFFPSISTSFRNVTLVSPLLGFLFLPNSLPVCKPFCAVYTDLIMRCEQMGLFNAKATAFSYECGDVLRIYCLYSSH